MRVLWPLLLLVILAPGASNGAAAKSAGVPSPPTKQPNIILITLDTTRADRMGFLGSKRELTPNLDALAAQSVVFTRAYAQVPLTTPSHAVILTGTYPQFNHVEDLAEPLAPEIPFLPDLLHRDGYHTAAFVGSMVLDPETSAAPGFDRGFDFYDAGFHNPEAGEDRYQSLERRAEDVADHAMEWLSQHQQTPFFVWLHFYDAHEPYDPPEPFKSRYASEPYDGEIAYTDSILGSVIEILQRHGLYQNTAIAVVADHGEALGEHGEKWHGMFLYDETIHVPLLLKLPGEKFAGKRVEDPVALADIAPTLLQAAHTPIPPAMQGQSLFPLIDPLKAPTGTQNVSRANKAQERTIYSETDYAHRVFGWSELRSWRVEKYLYVQAPAKELYNQHSDPDALTNLASTDKAIADTLDSQLSDFRKKTSSVPVEKAGINPEQLEKLRSLGYLGAGSGKANRAEQELIDPKDKIGFANAIHRSLFRLEGAQYEQALADLREIVQQYPADADIAYLEFGRAMIHYAKYPEAVPLLRNAVEKMPNSSMAHYQLGLALIKTGQWDAALPEIQAAVEYDPTSAQMHYYLAAVNNRMAHLAEATKEYEKALELDPNHFQANLRYGRLLFLEGNAQAALPRLTRAVKLDPESSEAHSALADAYEQLGQTQSAAEERAKAAGYQLSSK